MEPPWPASPRLRTRTPSPTLIARHTSSPASPQSALLPDLPHIAARPSGPARASPGPIHVFKNIPFAAPPSANATLADGSYGPACVQAGTGAPLGTASALLGPQSEDCLHLDVCAPGAAARGNATNLPVMH